MNFIRDFHAELETRGVPFCVLGWDPDGWNERRDFDFLVDRSVFAQANEVLEIVANRPHRVIVRGSGDAGRRHVLVALRDEGTVILARVDLQDVLIENGVPYFDTAFILDRTKIESGIRQPLLPVLASIYLVRSALRDRFPEYQKVVVERALSADIDSVRSALASLLDPALSDELIAAKEGRLPLSAVRRRVIGVRGSESMPHRLSSTFRRLASCVQRFVRPPGTFLCLVGVDGSGKTTIGRAVTNVLSAASFDARYIYCGHGIALPAIESPSYRDDIGSTTPWRAWRRPLHQVVKGVLFSNQAGRSLWFALALVKQVPRETRFYWRSIRPTLTRDGVVVADRLWLDYVVQAQDELPAWALRWFLWLFPMPSLTIHLIAEPSVIFSRKGERSLLELELGMQKLRRLCGHLDSAKELRTEGPVDGAVLSILRMLSRPAAGL